MKELKINCLIAGAQKAGTTSLHRYLGEHPEVEGHFTIEFSSFIDDTEFQKGIPHAIDQYYKFKNTSPKVLLAKSALFSKYDKAVRRLSKYNPECKLIFLIREPVARAFSCYTFERMNGGMQGKSFDDIVSVLENKEYEDGLYRLCIGLGRYDLHLETLLKYFPSKQIKVILFEDLKSEPKRIAKEVFDFLNIDNAFVPNLKKRHNKTMVVKSENYARLLHLLQTKLAFIKDVFKFFLPYHLFNKIRTTLFNSNKKEGSYTPMTSETEAYLKAYFKPHNKKLSNLLNRDLQHWNS